MLGWRPAGACEFHTTEKLRPILPTDFHAAGAARVFAYMLREAQLSEDEARRRNPMVCSECNFIVMYDFSRGISDPIVLPWRLGEDFTLYPADDYAPKLGPSGAPPRGPIRRDDPPMEL